MGRRAGLSSDDVRAAVLAAAAEVFARQGYAGASIAEITRAAGLSTGPVYAHFGSKAELFAATIAEHSDRELDDFLGSTAAPDDVPAVLSALGASLVRPQPERRSLLVEALVASRRDPAVATLMAEVFARRRRRFAAMVKGGQADGQIESRVSPDALARFSVVLGLGSLLLAALDDEDDGTAGDDAHAWQHLIDTLVDGLRPRADPPRG